MLLRHLGLEFREVLIRLDTPTTKDEIEKYGPSGRVPVLLDGELCVWDSLAICEYVAELAGRGLAARCPRARGRALGVRGDALGLRQPANGMADERPRAQPPQRHHARPGGGHRSGR